MGPLTRGHIIWMNFEPSSGREQSLWRPALVVSRGLVHPLAAPVAFVVPITKQAKGLPYEVDVPTGIKIDGELIGKPNLTALSGVALPIHLKSADPCSRDAIIIGKIEPDHPFYREVEEKVLAIIIG